MGCGHDVYSPGLQVKKGSKVEERWSIGYGRDWIHEAKEKGGIDEQEITKDREGRIYGGGKKV
jgi:hypothetical protein